MTRTENEFVFTLLRDAERALKRKGIRPEIERLGGVCHEVRMIHERMKSDDFAKARGIVKSTPPPKP
jgi:hypothetical protein